MQAVGRVDPLRAVDDPVTERGSRYIDFVIPGLLGMNLLGSGVWPLRRPPSPLSTADGRWWRRLPFSPPR